MTSSSADFRRILLEALIIVAVGAMLGLTFNYRLVMDLFVEGSPPASVEKEKAFPAAFPQPATLPEVRELLSRGALAVDARAAELFLEGHLPSARSLPLGEPEAMKRFMAEVPRERSLVVYCSGYGCPDSFDLAQEFIAAGYEDVRVYEGGYPEWSDAGLPVESGR